MCKEEGTEVERGMEISGPKVCSGVYILCSHNLRFKLRCFPSNVWFVLESGICLSDLQRLCFSGLFCFIEGRD